MRYLANDKWGNVRSSVNISDLQRSAKDARNGSISGSDGLGDEPGSLFIQCERCNVWQHGGCVGIMEEKDSPENYYCEECRPELHKILQGPKS